MTATPPRPKPGDKVKGKSAGPTPAAITPSSSPIRDRGVTRLARGYGPVPLMS